MGEYCFSPELAQDRRSPPIAGERERAEVYPVEGVEIMRKLISTIPKNGREEVRAAGLLGGEDERQAA